MGNASQARKHAGERVGSVRCRHPLWYPSWSSMRRLLLSLAYSNVLIAMTAGGFAAAALLLCSAPLSPLAVGLPTAAMYVVYTFDKVVRFDSQDDVNDPARSRFIRRWRPSLLGVAALCMVGGAALAARAGPWAALLFALPLFAGALYALPLLPAGARFRRIKDVTGLKSIYVAGTWAATAGLLPLVVAGAPLVGSWAALIACLWVLARFFINTVFFDIGDVEGDRESGTMTLPVVLGVERTRRALIMLNGATALLIVVGVEGLALSPSAHILNLLPLYAGVYLGLAKGRRELGFLCDVVVDGEGVIAGILSLLVCGGLMPLLLECL